jgi:hypothetical protein
MTTLPPFGYSKVNHPPLHKPRCLVGHHNVEIARLTQSSCSALHRHQGQGREQGPIRRVRQGAAINPGRAGCEPQGEPVPREHQRIDENARKIRNRCCVRTTNCIKDGKVEVVTCIPFERREKMSKQLRRSCINLHFPLSTCVYGVIRAKSAY